MFTAQRVTRTYTQHLVASPDQVFPLLCPVREAEWAEGWHAVIVYSQSGVAEQDCIFTTQHPGMADTIWIITRFDPQHHRIEFVNVTPQDRAIKIEISLEADGADASIASVAYTYTGLSEHGNMFVAHMTQPHFDQQMIEWEDALNHFLRTGTMLSVHHS